jgi:UDP-N-acetylmuramoyl-tripeptide--D-alanyl-D-alanine ligase
MAITATIQEIASVVGGAGGGREVVVGAQFDSREIKGGELFVALPGEVTHGHQFLNTAFERGAAGALVEDQRVANESSHPQRCIVVKDSLKAFQQLASWWRARFQFPVIGVTGSVGKTTTKEMLACILAGIGPGCYSQKSFNNHVGVPYTLLQLSPQHQWAVIEMGMNHAGEIALLSGITKPTLAMITALAPAHIENLGSIEGIAAAKSEIVDGLSTGATVILPFDTELLHQAVRNRLNSRSMVVKTFGVDPRADAVLHKVSALGLDGLEVDGEIKDLGGVKFNLKTLGRHNALNSIAAALAASLSGLAVDAKKISAGLTAFHAPLMRLQRFELSDGRKILDDSYNANPASMRAALEIASELIAQGLRVGAVLGDMRELGEHSPGYHSELAEEALRQKLEFVVTVGPFSAVIAERLKAAGRDGQVASDPRAAAKIVATTHPMVDPNFLSYPRRCPYSYPRSSNPPHPLASSSRQPSPPGRPQLFSTFIGLIGNF